MKTREARETDFPLAAEWMAKRYGEPFPDDFFPKTGVVAEDDSGRVRAIIPVYFEMNSAVAVSGHCMADPENTARESYDAIDAALRAVVDFARRNKRKYLVSIYGNRGVNRMAGRIGMIPADIVEEKFLQLR